MILTSSCDIWMFLYGSLFVCWFLFFFFKQKTAYEMRISDWSSDVCSSDLDGTAPPRYQHRETLLFLQPKSLRSRRQSQPPPRQIGRASCRERVCQYV